MEETNLKKKMQAAGVSMYAVAKKAAGLGNRSPSGAREEEHRNSTRSNN